VSAVLERLAASALLGTARRPPAPPEVSGALGAAIASMPWSERPEAALMQAAAGAVVHARAGARAAVFDDAIPPAAPDEAVPVCPGAASRLLEVLLTDRDGEVLVPEWLERVAARGERAHPVALPALLERASAERGERQLVLRAGGARLRWLAGFDDRWGWAAAPAAGATGEDEDAVWALGAWEVRLELLHAVRDADPGRARALITSSWEQDPPEQRASFVEALRARLGSEDEPLLERALDDRRSEVRAAAAEVLASLEGSAFRERMRERLFGLIRIEGTLRRRLEVELPDLPDPEARRDGVRATRREGMGERAAALSDIVAGAGLSAWIELAGTTPKAVVALARGNDHEQALRAGWRIAALRERDPAWCAAIADVPDADLLAVIAAVDEASVVRILREAASPPLLAALPGPWGARLSAAAVEWFAGAAYADRGLARVVATRVDPDTLEAMLEVVDRHREATPSAALDTLGRVLHHRQALIEELPLR
jgi:hypothetical protein